ncbi:MAG: hypothetical protein EXR77_06705 [Myxococcales bacterium]|nr:hypothetical protein [Myxococcales bacterium]
MKIHSVDLRAPKGLPLAIVLRLCGFVWVMAACSVPVEDASKFEPEDVAADAAAVGDVGVEAGEETAPTDTAPGDGSADTGGCPVSCDDQNPCTADLCASGKCSNVVKEGLSCDDGNPCTLGDLCEQGACKAGKAKECSSDDPCLNSKCDPVQGGKCKLTEADDGTACNDKSACSESDKCKGGACKGAPVACKDDNPCTTDDCDSGSGCTFTKLTGKFCDDDNPCTLGDACADGTCKEGKAKECISPDACFASKCSLADGKCKLTEIQEGEGCNDSSQCTQKDVCKGGVCKGEVIACDDKNPCTIDSCDGKTGCTTAAGSGPCNDGNPCTVQDACGGAVCVGLAAQASVTCDDDKSCTTDSCDAKAGCQNTANTQACDDGNPCTKSDTCKDGSCAAGTNACSCKTDADCVKEEDGNKCNGTLFCDKSEASPKCNVHKATIIVCDTSADTACSASQCSATTGKCAAVAETNGVGCDADGSVCSQNDACAGGLCKAGLALGCDDKNPCTTDSCNATKGCVQIANTLMCDADGDGCTLSDKCQDKVCLAGAKKVCDDNEACTTDSCNPLTGTCGFEGKNWEGKGCDADNSVCTAGDVCKTGKCTVGAIKSCDDSNKCTNDNCDAKNGCANVASTIPCDDGNFCTSGDQCAQGKCTGTAVNAAVLCEDNNACTNDACEPSKGCAYSNNTAACNDGNTCTFGDVCSAGKCASGASQCACQADTDCVDDGNLCNGKSFCDKGSLPYACKVKSGTVVSCTTTGDTTCSANTCDIKTGNCAMKAVNNSKTCDDGSVCTLGDTCSNGTCMPGSSVSCDDKVLCTSDSCDAKTGCKTIANTLPCDDTNACTKGDVCANGSCFPGLPLNCDDNNPCTEQLCDKPTGCKNSPNTASCNDNNSCTKADVCAAGTCKGIAISCDDGNPCTTEACDASKGCLKPPGNDGVTCTDNDLCTSIDTCLNGNCAPGSAIICDDKLACTKDSCHAIKGCVYEATTGVGCTDGNPCTGTGPAPDVCLNTGQCGGGAAVLCNDNNPCTTDACSPGAGGCGSTANLLPCDDGQLCTIKDTCGSGKCAGIAGAPDADGDGFGSNKCAGGTDCDDGNKALSPGAKEDCTTPTDDNCDSQTNELNALTCTPYAFDGDGDGVGGTNAAGEYSTQCWCSPPTGSKFTAKIGALADCDDANPKISPLVKEDCATAIDDNCDKTTNQVGALNCSALFADGDGDGYYPPGALNQCLCAASGNYSSQKGGDCNDANKEVSPSEKEDCATAADDNCNGTANDKDALNCKEFFYDDDQDGFFAGGTTIIKPTCFCGPSGKYSVTNKFSGDCDDGNAGIAPNQPERCDGHDQNCDGNADEGCDDDKDGYCGANRVITSGAQCASTKRPGYGAYNLGRALILTSDASANPASLRTIVNVDHFHQGIDIRAVGGSASGPTPTLAELRRYGVVGVTTDIGGGGALANATELGNVLKAWVNEGGGLVLFWSQANAGYVPAGALADSGWSPFAKIGSQTLAPMYISGKGSLGIIYAPQSMALNHNSNFSTSYLVPGQLLGTVAFADAVAEGDGFSTATWMTTLSSGSTTQTHVPLVVYNEKAGLGRIVGLNFRHSTTNATLHQLARNAFNFAATGFGDDCNDTNYQQNAGATDDTCNSVDENCDGFDSCASTCSAFENIANINGWDYVTVDNGPDVSVPATVSGTGILYSQTPWKGTFWANASSSGSTGIGIAFGMMDEPPASASASGYPDTGTKWMVARTKFTLTSNKSRFEFRYRYMPDFLETSEAFDNFAVRIDSAANAVLTMTPSKKGIGNWQTGVFQFTSGLPAGEHTLFLFFKTGDGNFNAGGGAAFDQFRTCN